METIINKKISLKNTAVCLGSFDGIHLGHQQLIDSMKLKAKEYGLKSTVFTFYNHPATMVKGRELPRYLMNNEQKIEVLNSFEIDFLYMMSFDERLMKMDPESFVKDILINRLNAKYVVVGYNYRFGYKGKGDTDMLKKFGQEYGFQVEVISPVQKNGKVISSTLIRSLINEGNMIEANSLLGRRYSIEGNVIKGRGRGKGLGFRTANLGLVTDYVIPKFGVYKTYSLVNGNDYLSITNVGQNPTFGDKGINIETHIYDFEEDIYGENIEVRFDSFIRGERKHNSREALIKQVMKDMKIVKGCK